MVRLQKYETELRAIWILFIPAPPFPQWRVGGGQVESGDRVEFDVRSFPPWSGRSLVTPLRDRLATLNPTLWSVLSLRSG